MRNQLSVVCVAVVCLAACGTPGAPRPPSLRLAETVRDLAATRQGSTVTLTWTEPQRTTDGETIRALGPTLVCMGVNDFPMTHCDQMVADLTLAQFASCRPEVGKPASCQVTLAPDIQQQNPRGQATYAVEVLNPSGRSAGLSNQVRVPTAPTLPPPQKLTSEVRSDAVLITATGEQRFAAPPGTTFAFHLYRHEQGSQSEVDLGAESAHLEMGGAYAVQFQDRTFEWEKTYLYHTVAITTVSLPDGSIVDVPGDPSKDVKVFAHDIFPPSVPTGLQAVASGVGQPPFVDLTWAPNTEADLAGYNIYRDEQGQPPVKINSELVKTPSYRDGNVERGKTYFYSVTAIDLRGNESGKSVETSESVR